VNATSIEIPNEVTYIIKKLEELGYEAYAVGGCVRDAILGATPNDWDVCTQALPQQVIECFKENKTIATGLKHGTVTLILNNKPFEITTYRVEGTYSDNRRPDEVEFVTSLKDDLSRRDFTINAMAYHPDKGLMDFFGGMKDIELRVIRTVGDANSRFNEDALRIMRALRFSSVLGFEIGKNTKLACTQNKGLLQNIAVERISEEFNKLIIGNNVFEVLMKYTQVITEVIPEIKPMVLFEQNSKYHCFDVFHHTAASIAFAQNDVIIRMALLFHDVAKPNCYSEDEDGGHFYGHPQVGAEITKDILTRLKYSNEAIESITELVLYHDIEIPKTSKSVKKWLNKIGEARFRQLLEVKRADALAHTQKYGQIRINALKETNLLLNDIIEKQQCFSLKDLAVNGRDLMDAGFSEGVEVGDMLNLLIDMVIDEKLPNDREMLLKAARENLHA